VCAVAGTSNCRGAAAGLKRFARALLLAIAERFRSRMSAGPKTAAGNSPGVLPPDERRGGSLDRGRARKLLTQLGTQHLLTQLVLVLIFERAGAGRAPPAGKMARVARLREPPGDVSLQHSLGRCGAGRSVQPLQPIPLITTRSLFWFLANVGFVRLFAMEIN